ncbi:MAG: hypothetical protein MJA83_12175, partial [Gammaproteobacteria bacterium]|nr:hypothetical protein [Gammaproteobacteria bacterium]
MSGSHEDLVIVDGDTIRLRSRTPGRKTGGINFRIYGIQADELDDQRKFQDKWKRINEMTDEQALDNEGMGLGHKIIDSVFPNPKDPLTGGLNKTMQDMIPRSERAKSALSE